MVAPIRGAKTYTHQPVKSTPTMSGPSVRAGFIDAPLMGLANRPSRATVAPTAIAAVVPDAARPRRRVEDDAYQDRGEDDLHDQRLPLPARAGDRIVPASADIAEDELQEQRATDGAGELRQPVREDLGAREDAAAGESEGDREVDVQAGERALGIDQGHHERARRNHRRRPADRAPAKHSG